MGFLLNLLGGGVIKSVVGAVTGSVTAWAERKRIRQQASIELEAKKATAGIDWDQLQAKNAQSSWKDEYWTIILSIPMIFCFIPGLDDDVMRGFEALDKTPDYYKAAVGIAIAAAFGYRKLMKFMGAKEDRKNNENT